MDIEKRLHEHNHLKSGAHYTKIRRPVEMVYSEELETLSLARKREVAVKKLSKEQKVALIKGSVSIVQP